MHNEPQYTVSISEYRRPRVTILLSGKTIKQFESSSLTTVKLERLAEIYCQKQGWEFNTKVEGVAYDYSNNAE